MTLTRDHLTKARKEQGLTALRLAEIADLTEQKVYAVERGRHRPSREEALRWAAALGMRATIAFPDLFSGDGLNQ